MGLDLEDFYAAHERRQEEAKLPAAAPGAGIADPDVREALAELLGSATYAARLKEKRRLATRRTPPAELFDK